MFRNSVILCSLILLLSGCADRRPDSDWWKPALPVQQRSRSQGSFKVGNAYQVSGKTYTPVESYSYDETGIASWYGDEFHGKRTANGEVFNKNDLTAAHPTLQIPALIRVTNLGNGRSAVLRVNDRGPFSKSRLIDVSHQSARVLGFDGQGTARVRVQVLDKESRIMADAARRGYTPAVQMAMAFGRVPAPAPALAVQQIQEKTIEVADNSGAINTIVDSKVTATDLAPSVPVNVTKKDVDDLNKDLFRKFPVTPTSIYIQVGAFSSTANANALRPRLATIGNVIVSPTTVNGQPFNRVRIGPIASVSQADAMLKKTVGAGFPTARIVVD